MGITVGQVSRRLLLAAGAAALVGGYLREDPGPPTRHPTRPHGAPQPAAYPAVATPSECASRSAQAGGSLEPQQTVSCTGDHIALTLDDGPDPVWTPKLLALLHRYRIQATFFMVGSRVTAHPQIAAAVLDAGHRIGNHTFTHPLPLSAVPRTRIRTEIMRASDAITAACGHHPTLFRAPGGAWSPAVLDACAEAGMRPVHWTVDTRDWTKPGTNQIIDTLLTQTRPGSIILDHDAGGDQYQTLTALAIALPLLVDAGYHFTRL